MNDNSLLEASWVLFTYGWPYWAYGLGITSVLVIWGSGCARLGWRITFLAVATLVLWVALFVGVDSGYRAWQSIPDAPREAFSDTGGPFFMLFLGWLPSVAVLGILHFLSRHCWRMFSKDARRVSWFLILFLLAPLASAPAAADTAKPNILFILTDDQGYGDVGRHGHPWLKTPNQDALHDQSARFQNFYVSPSCSPTRAALMTGMHEFRSGVTHTTDPREHMDVNAVILPQLVLALCL